MKVQLKDLKSLRITDVKNEVVNLTDSQLTKLYDKISKIKDIVGTESNYRFENKMIEEIDDEIEATLTHEEEDEVQEA